MKICKGCGETNPLSGYYRSGDSYRSQCKECFKGTSVDRVSEWRRQTKEKLVAHHGSKCLDCGYEGPPFMFDFDHRDPSQKKFGIGASGFSRKYEIQLEESLKCDLVCANCHRMRTHKQRCNGCKYC
jgi:hypothetical protein